MHKEFGCQLKVVMIEKINVGTKKVGHVLLFSSDLELGWEKLIDYYSLRFRAIRSSEIDKNRGMMTTTVFGL